MPIYMKYGDIKGQVTTDGFKDWIELESFSFGVSRDFRSAGSGRVREAAHPNLADIHITKSMDLSSSKLFHDSVAGQHTNKAEIKFTTTVKNKIDTYLTLELSDCAVSSYQVSGAGQGNIMQESLSLNFTKITYKPSIPDATGMLKAGAIVTYDLLKMLAS